MRPTLLTLFTLLLAGDGMSASRFEEEHHRGVVANPPGISLNFSVADGRRGFRIGERIPVRLTFKNDREGVYTIDAATYDRSGRLHLESYRVSPGGDVVDPAADYFLSGVVPSFMGGIRQYLDPGSRPVELEFNLNEWLRFDAPGRYRLYAVSRRLSAAAIRDSDTAHAMDRTPPVSSNIVDIEIYPRDEKWERQTIERAVTELSECKSAESPLSPLGIPARVPPDRAEKYREAAVALRFLGTNAAVDAIFQAFGLCGSRFDLQLTLGLVAAIDRAYVRARLEAALADPDLGIESHDLTLMAILAGAEQADWRIRDLLTDPAHLPPELSEKLYARQTEHQARLREYAHKLALALPGKTPWAARFSVRTVEAFTPEAARKLADLAELDAPAAAQWVDLSPAQQLNWLSASDRWALLNKEQILPVLLALAEKDPPHPTLDDTVMLENLRWQTAVMRLHELSPAKAQQILIEQVKRLDTVLYARSKLLDLLPPSVPELSEPLARNLELDPEGIAHLVARFADESIYERVEAVYRRRAGEWPCDPAESLLGYLLRARPATGAEHIREALRARNRTGCYKTLLPAAAKYYQGAELLEIAREFTSDPDPEVAAHAKRLLAASSTPN